MKVNMAADDVDGDVLKRLLHELMRAKIAKDEDPDAPQRFRHVLKIEVPYDVLQYLVKRAIAENTGLESVVVSVLEDAMDEPEPIPPQRALKQAMEHVEAMEPGRRFTLPELFSDEDWRRILSPRAFGKQFKNAVESGSEPLAKHVGKTVANMAIYQRCGTTKDV